MSGQDIQSSSQQLLFGWLKAALIDVKQGLKALPRWERCVHLLWLSGPFLLLIERSPADIWLSLIVIAFLFRSTVHRDFTWLSSFWVRSCFLFFFVCMVSSLQSTIVPYAFSESVAWFRFPLFAVATTFWLAKDKRFLFGMLLSTGAGMLVMMIVLLMEFVLVGQTNGRLTWPYGDPVSGNYLAKVGLPAFVIMVALSTGAKTRVANFMAALTLFSMIASLMTGERINLLVKICAGMLAAFIWRPNFRRITALIIIEISAIIYVVSFMPEVQYRFVDMLIAKLPTGPHSDYYRVMGAGITVFETSPWLGIGPATHRELCPEIIGSMPEFRCDNHPHNFFIQLLAETGILGLISGVIMFGSLTLAAFSGWRKNCDNVVAATAFIVPLGMFFPIQSTGDFFGQWSNVFMWSAVALSLAAARTLAGDPKKK